MKKRAKKLMALVLSLALVLGLIGTASATVGKQTKELDYNNITVTLNGKQVELKDAKGNAVEPFAIDGTTYIPVRAVAEALGLSADWDKTAKAVVLSQQSAEVQKVVANCSSEPYGKAINSFTFYVNSTLSIMNLTVDDFKTEHCVYDGMETHNVFGAKATGITFTPNTMTVEVEPFYPDVSFTREGYWSLNCTNAAFSLDAGSELIYSDPVVEAFKESTLTHGDALLDYYLYTPEGNGKDMPIVIFNSGGTGISVTGDPYGANFAVSFIKPDVQASMPCYVLYPQRMEGSTDDLCAGVKEIVDGLIAEGKVDADRVYMTGESAGSLFTMNFVSRYPGYNAAIAIFNGGGSYENTTLEETMKVDAEAPFSDAEMQRLADSGTKVMLVQSLGDTTSYPIKYATTYQKLVNCGMKPGIDVIWHYYTAEKFNALLNDRTYWEPVADAGYVTDPITGVKTYYYPEGKLHNSSYPAANDEYIKIWLMDQRRDEYSVTFTENYSAQYTAAHTDYSVIPERYTRMAVLEEVPCVPAGQKSTVTVYTDDAGEFYYLSFMTFFQPDTPQYVEAVVVNGVGHVVMDCSGTWWTNDITFSTMPHILSLTNIDWQPYNH